MKSRRHLNAILTSNDIEIESLKWGRTRALMLFVFKCLPTQTKDHIICRFMCNSIFCSHTFKIQRRESLNLSVIVQDDDVLGTHLSL